MFRLAELPGWPVAVEMFRPGTEPCSMWESEWELLFSRDLVSTVEMAPVRLTFLATP